MEKDHKAHSLSSRFIDDMKLDSPSTVRAGVKKKMFDYAADEEFSGFFVSTKGYLKGILTSLVSNVIPLGLSLGAVLTKRNSVKMFRWRTRRLRRGIYFARSIRYRKSQALNF